MLTSLFHFDLPPALIAQFPLPQRDASRLLHFDRSSQTSNHRQFSDFPALLSPGDLLILNNSKVIPARLRCQNPSTLGELEIFLLEEVSPNLWWTLMKPGKRAPIGRKFQLFDIHHQITSISAEVREVNVNGHRLLRFEGSNNLLLDLQTLGSIPLPPYIDRSPDQKIDTERYQTCFASPVGSVAAPTAGLHFTPPLLEALKAKGVAIEYVTLHVGFGTFAPVKEPEVEKHLMHEERYSIPASVPDAIRQAKSQGRRIIAVGTTSLRVLESSARAHGGEVIAGEARTSIFIYPPARFAVVDSLLTNFHLPESTLLMLVASFLSPGDSEGIEHALRLYRDAVTQQYRFFSYGDAMFIS